MGATLAFKFKTACGVLPGRWDRPAGGRSFGGVIYLSKAYLIQPDLICYVQKLTKPKLKAKLS